MTTPSHNLSYLTYPQPSPGSTCDLSLTTSLALNICHPHPVPFFFCRSPSSLFRSSTPLLPLFWCPPHCVERTLATFSVPILNICFMYRLLLAFIFFGGLRGVRLFSELLLLLLLDQYIRSILPRYFFWNTWHSCYQPMFNPRLIFVSGTNILFTNILLYLVCDAEPKHGITRWKYTNTLKAWFFFLAILFWLRMIILLQFIVLLYWRSPKGVCYSTSDAFLYWVF